MTLAKTSAGDVILKPRHAGHEGAEVGCGPGSFAEDLVGMELTCLDPSPEMLARRNHGLMLPVRLEASPLNTSRPLPKTSRCPTTP